MRTFMFKTKCRKTKKKISNITFIYIRTKKKKKEIYWILLWLSRYLSNLQRYNINTHGFKGWRIASKHYDNVLN